MNPANPTTAFGAPGIEPCWTAHLKWCFALARGRSGVFSPMPAVRNRPKRENFNSSAQFPFQLRPEDFEIAMQDVYDLFFDVNTGLLEKGLQRLDDFLRPAIMSGLISDLLTASMSKHSRALTQNNYFNGHPDLVVKGAYPNDALDGSARALACWWWRLAATNFSGKVCVENFRAFLPCRQETWRVHE